MSSCAPSEACLWSPCGCSTAHRPCASTPAGQLDAFPQMRGLRVNVGTEGSGVPILMDKLLDANHMCGL